jgi:hypothetical protein
MHYRNGTYKTLETPLNLKMIRSLTAKISLDKLSEITEMTNLECGFGS